MKGIFRKILSTVLCLLIACETVWSNPASLSSRALRIPSELGRIKETKPAERPQFHRSSISDATLYLIEDAHTSLEAQKNTARILQYLIQSRGLRTVYEEGYEGEVPTQKYFGWIRAKKARQKLADDLAERLEIGGAEYLHLIHPGRFRLIGADSRALHDENIFWYSRSAEFFPLVKRQLAQFRSRILAAMEKRLDPRGSDWLRLRMKFAAGELDLPEYWRQLSRQRIKHKLPVLDPVRFPELAALEKILDPGSRESSRPGLSPERLIAELDLYEDETAEGHFGEEDLAELYFHFRTTDRILRLSELRLSFAEYQLLSVLDLEDWIPRALACLARAERRPAAEPVLWIRQLAPAFRFYETAYLRDFAVIEKIRNDFPARSEPHASSQQSLNPPGSGGGGEAALVFGGFHTAHLKALLAREGFRVVVITPAVGGTDELREKIYARKMESDGGRLFSEAAAPIAGDFSKTRPVYAHLDELPAPRVRAEVRNLLRRIFSTRELNRLEKLRQTPARSELRITEEAPRVLEMTNEMDALDRRLARDAKSQGKKYFRLRLRNDEERIFAENLVTIDPETGRRTRRDGLISQVIREGGILFLDASGADPKKLEPFNSLFDDAPFWGSRRNAAHPDLKIVIGIPPEEMEEYANTVYSRSRVLDDLTEAGSEESSAFEHLREKSLKAGEKIPDDAALADLNQSPYFYEELVERLRPENGQWKNEEGALVRAIREGKKILVIRGVREDDDFQYFINQLFLSRKLIVNGETLALPLDFEIRFQEKDFSRTSSERKIYPAGTLSAGEFTWIIHNGNAGLLRRLTEVDTESGFLNEKPGILETARRIRIVEDLSDEGWWHLLMHSTQDFKIEIAPGVTVPEVYADCVEWRAGKEGGGKKDDGRLSKETAISRPVPPGNVLQEMFSGGQVYFVEGEDLGYLSAAIQGQVPAEKLELIREIGSGTRKNHLADDLRVNSDAEEAMTFDLIKQKMLRDLEAGKTVVLEGAGRSPDLLKDLRTLWAPRPYLLVNGKAVEIGSFAGTLILTAQSTLDQGELLPGSSRLDLPENRRDAYWQILAREFPAFNNEAGKTIYGKIWGLAKKFEELPSPQNRGLSGEAYPRKFRLDLARLRVFFKLLPAFDGNTFEAFESTWLVHYRGDADVRDFLRVQAKITFGRQEAKRGKSNAVAGRRLEALLNRARSAEDWSRFYWQFVNTLGISDLFELADQLSAQNFSSQSPNTEPLTRLQKALVKKSAGRGSKEYTGFLRKIWDLEGAEVSRSPEMDDSLELDRLTPAERTDLVARITKAVGLVFLQGAPGTGKSFLLPHVAEALGFRREEGEVFGPFTTGSTVNQQELLSDGHPVSRWLQASRGILLWDEANTADHPDFHYFLQEGLLQGKPVILTGNDTETEDRRPVHLVEENGVTIPFESFDHGFYLGEAERLLASLDEFEAGEAAKVLVRLHEMFVQAGPQHEFSIREIQESANRILALSARSGESGPDAAQVIFQTWLAYAQRFDPAEQRALRLLIEKMYGVDLRELEEARISEARKQFEKKPEFQGISLVDPSAGYLAYLSDSFGMREARQQSRFVEPGKVSSLILGPSGWGKDAILERFLKSMGLKDGFDPANNAVPGSQKYYLLNGSMDDRALDEVIQQAKNEGSIVGLREMNFLRTGVLEGKLNDILSVGARPHAGFLFIGTLNGAHFTGRNKLSSPLMSRSSVFQAEPYTGEHLLAIAEKFVQAARDRDGSLQRTVPEAAIKSLACFQSWVASKVKNPEFLPTTRELKRAVDYLAAHPGASWQEAARVVYGAVYLRWQIRDENSQELLEEPALTEIFRPEASIEQLRVYQKIADILAPPALGDLEVKINTQNARSFFDAKAHQIILSSRDIQAGRGWRMLSLLLGQVLFVRRDFDRAAQGEMARGVEAILAGMMDEGEEWKCGAVAGSALEIFSWLELVWIQHLMSQSFDRSAFGPGEAPAEARQIAEVIRAGASNKPAESQNAVDAFYEAVTREKAPLSARQIFRFTLFAYLYGLVSVSEIEKFQAALAARAAQHPDGDFDLVSLIGGDPFAALLKPLQGKSHPEGITEPNGWETLTGYWNREVQGERFYFRELGIQFAQSQLMDWAETLAEDYRTLPEDFGPGLLGQLLNSQPAQDGPEGPSLKEAVRGAETAAAREDRLKRQAREMRERQANVKFQNVLRELDKIESQISELKNGQGRMTEPRFLEIRDQLSNPNRRLPGAVRVWLDDLKRILESPVSAKELGAAEARVKKLLNSLPQIEMDNLRRPGPGQFPGSGMGGGRAEEDQRSFDLEYPERGGWSMEGPVREEPPIDPSKLVSLREEKIENAPLTEKADPVPADPRFEQIRRLYPEAFLERYRAFFDWLTDSGDVSGGDVIHPAVLARTGSVALSRQTRGAVSRKLPKDIILAEGGPASPSGGELSGLSADLWRFLFSQGCRVSVVAGQGRVIRGIQSVETLAAALRQASKVKPEIPDRKGFERQLRLQGFRRPWLTDLKEVQSRVESAYLYGLVKMAKENQKLAPVSPAEAKRPLTYEEQKEKVLEFLRRFKLLPKLATFNDSRKTIKLIVHNSGFEDREFEVFKELTCISEINIDGPKLTDAVLEHFRGLPNLEWLNVDRIPVTSSAIHHFIASHPNRERLKVASDTAGIVAKADVPKAIWDQYNPPAALSFEEQVAEAKQFLRNHEAPETRLRVDERAQTLILDLSLLTKVTDKTLQDLKPLVNLIGLILEGTTVTDAGLQHLKPLENLRTLNLNETKVTDDGLQHLQPLANLTTLRLVGIKVTGSGLQYLSSLVKLKWLYLGQTKVTDDAIYHFIAAHPNRANLAVDKSNSKRIRIEDVPNEIREQHETKKGLSFDEQMAEAKKFLRDRSLKEDLLTVDQPGQSLKLNLGSKNITGNDLEHLKDLTNLTELYLGGNQITDAGLEHLKGLTHLRELNLSRTQITDAGLEHLKGLTHLRELNLSRTQITDAGLEHLEALTHLRELNLSRTQITDAGLEHLKALTNLSKLYLSVTQITDAGLEHLKALTHLTTLSLDGNQITDAGLEHLNVLTHLTMLDLSKTPITDAGLEHLKGLTHLTTLHLGGNQITDAGLEHLKVLTLLTTLHLGGNQITDAGLEHLKVLIHLTTLNLGGNQITDAGLEHLKGLTYLTTLNLGGNQITDAGLEHLKGLTILTKLYLGRTPITDDSIHHFIAAHPNRENLEVVNSQGNPITKTNVPKAIWDQYNPPAALSFEEQVALAETLLRDLRLKRKLSTRKKTPRELGWVTSEKDTILLSLEQFDISDSVMKQIGRLTRLRYLNIEGSRFKKEALGYLSGLSLLEEMDLSGCDASISNDSLQYLIRLPKLEVLNFSRPSEQLKKYPVLMLMNSLFPIKVTTEALFRFIVEHPNRNSLVVTNPDGEEVRLSDVPKEILERYLPRQSMDEIKFRSLEEDFWGFVNSVDLALVNPRAAWREAGQRIRAEGLGDLTERFREFYQAEAGKNGWVVRSELRLAEGRELWGHLETIQRARVFFVIDRRTLAGLSESQLEEYRVLLAFSPGSRLYIFPGRGNKASQNEKRLIEEFSGESALKVQILSGDPAAEFSAAGRMVLVGDPQFASDYAAIENQNTGRRGKSQDWIKLKYESREDRGLPALGLILEISPERARVFLGLSDVPSAQSGLAARILAAVAVSSSA